MAESILRNRQNHHIHACFVRKEYRECLGAIESCLQEVGGQSEYPLYIKGLIMRQRGKIEDSLPIFQTALFLNPRNINNVKQVGQTLYLLGKYKEALEVFEEATDLNSEDRAVWYCKGLCCKFLGDLDEAVENFKTSNSILQSEKTFMAIAEILELQKENDEALECYLEAAETFPENSDVLTACGLMYQKMGDQMKAFEYLGNALTYNPRNAKAILGAGAILQSSGDYDVALTKYRVAVTQTPNNPYLWNNVGMAFFGKKKLVAAVACLKQAVYLAPFEASINYNLGVVHLHTEQYASAFHFFSSAINLQKVPNLKPTKDEAKAYGYLALSLAKLEDFENSCAAYAKAIEMNREDPVLYLNYAITLNKFGENKKASDMLLLCMQKIETCSTKEEHLNEELPETAEKLGSCLGLTV